LPSILHKIKTIQDVGLGYIKLGQPSTTLSGGESQRVKLATELSKMSKGNTVYILDEPTSHLDIETEFEIKEKLLELFKGRTVIIATHRLHWLNNVDYVLNLKQGKVSDFEKVTEFKNSPRFEELKANLVGGSYSEQ